MAEAYDRGVRPSPRAVTSIHTLGRTRVFTLSTALELFPLVRAITAASATELEPISIQLRDLFQNQQEINQLEKSYERIVRRWVGKMERLGLVVKGLWLVDFDTGDGYLCWKYPETELAHYHPYDKGFNGRRSIAEIIATQAPDWA